MGHLLGQTAPAMPLFVVEALVVEAVAWRALATPLAARLGLSRACSSARSASPAEYAWTHVVMPYPWTPALLDEGLPTAILAGLAGGTLGALLGAGLRGELPPRRTRRIAAGAAAVIVVALGVNALWTSTPAECARR